MTPEEQAQARQYQQNLTPELKRALVDGKIDVFQFMSRSSGGQYSPETIRNTFEGRQPFGAGQAAVQSAVNGLQQVINDYRQGIASDRALQQAYATAMTQYERGLYQSYQTAQQQQPTTTIPGAQPPLFTNEPFATGPSLQYPETALPPMTITTPPTNQYQGPGGIFPLPPYAPPPAAPPAAVPPSAAPSVMAPPAAPGAQPPAAPSPQAPLGPIPSTVPTMPSGLGGGLGGPPVDVSYFGGAGPVVQQIAQMYGVNLNTALMLLQIMQQTGQPIPAMQYGGSPQAGQPVLVGERGPEVFTPNLPGSITPIQEWSQDIPGIRDLERAGVHFNPEAFERWLQHQPRSRNIEDRRSEPPSYEGREFDWPLGNIEPKWRR
jgi:hypothetical protein